MPDLDSIVRKPTKLAIQRQRQLDGYPAATDLIPLNKPGRKVRMPNGKTVALGKAPLHSGWQKKQYDSKDVIRTCLAEGNNIGVRLHDDQLVLDVDTRAGGLDGLSNMAHDLGIDFDQFPTVKTPTGGLHIYMGIPANTLVRDTLENEAFKGVECKSKGRQVVAAGSQHPQGGLYQWDTTKPSLKDGWPAAPRTLVSMIRRPPRAAVAGGGQYTNEQIAAMLATMKPEDFKTQSIWLQLMQACHHASNGEARFEFIQWSVTDPEYADHADIIGRRWDSLDANKGNAITFATLRHFVNKHGDPSMIPSEGIGDDFDDGVAEQYAESPLVPDWLEGGPIDDEAANTEVALLRGQGLTVNRASEAEDTFTNALTAIHASGLQPSWNELKQNVEFRGTLGWPEVYGHVLTDHLLRLVRLFLMEKYQGNAYEPSPANLHEAIMTIAYGKRFNPVVDYLDSVKWDGTPRIAHLFGRYFHCGDDAYTRGVSKAFMVGAVQRARHPGCKFDTMPVLKSPQGWDKSTGVRKLFGDEFFSDAELGNLANKDAPMKLRGIWVQEFAEIDSLTVQAVGVLKAFCSRAVDRQRDPYGRVVADVPRSSVFIATVNEGGYLKDATGARRFWPLEVRDRIDVAAIEADRDQLWAEAATMESAGESSVLPKELWPDAAARQDAQTTDDPWTELLANYLRDRETIPIEEDDGTTIKRHHLPPHAVHTSELFDAVGLDKAQRTRGQSQRIRTIMEARLGWRPRSSVKVFGVNSSGYVRLDERGYMR